MRFFSCLFNLGTALDSRHLSMLYETPPRSPDLQVDVSKKQIVTIKLNC